MSKESSARQVTRTRILDATERLLECKPSQNFRVAEIASEAGVSPSLVIQYFNTKDEVVLEASIRRMMRVNPELFQPFIDGQSDFTLWDLFKFTLERDIGFAHMTADVMSLSWRWTPEDDARFFEALAPRRVALTRLLAKEVGKPLPSGAEEAVEIMYAGVLRRAIIHQSGPEAAYRELKEKIEILLEGLR